MIHDFVATPTPFVVGLVRLGEVFVAPCRAARAMVDMTQAQLADASKVSLRSIIHFEKGERTPVPNNLAAIRAALDAEGVEFIDENGGGPGVRLRNPE